MLSQARFLSPALHSCIDALFQEDALAHLRRAQGFIRHARDEINRFGRTEAEPRIAAATAQMQRFEKHKVSFFTEQIERLRKQKLSSVPALEIERIPGNPMLRGTDIPAGELREHGQQLTLLPENERTHEHDTSQASDAGAQAPRHGNDA